MLFINRTELENYINKAVNERVSELALHKLQKNAYYILVVPEGINVDLLRESFSVLKNTDYNIVVVTADHVNLIEME